MNFTGRGRDNSPAVQKLVVPWDQGANGLVSLYLLCFAIYSIKTLVQGDELVVKASGWSGFARLSFFPVTQVICSPICWFLFSAMLPNSPSTVTPAQAQLVQSVQFLRLYNRVTDSVWIISKITCESQGKAKAQKPHCCFLLETYGKVEEEKQKLFVLC